jgi:hypothetical protein
VIAPSLRGLRSLMGLQRTLTLAESLQRFAGLPRQRLVLGLSRELMKELSRRGILDMLQHLEHSRSAEPFRIQPREKLLKMLSNLKRRRFYRRAFEQFFMTSGESL